MAGMTIVHNDGSREYIPDARSLSEQRAAAKAEMRMHATNAIQRDWPTWRQINAALGIYGVTGHLACQKFIEGVRSETDRLDAKIDAADAKGLDALNLNPWG